MCSCLAAWRNSSRHLGYRERGGRPTAAPSGGPTVKSAPWRVEVRAGNYQSARAGRPFAAQLSAVVLDERGTARPGVRVTFKVTSGSAVFAFGSPTATSTANATGVAISQVLAAGPRAGSVRVAVTAGVAVRPTVFQLRVLPAPARRNRRVGLRP